MKLVFTNKEIDGKITLIKNECFFDQYYFKQREIFTSHTIAWNKGAKQIITIDEVAYEFGTNTVLPIMMNQSFLFERPEDIVAWQFNREFYCVVNNDAEVGCVGFLFFGPSPTMFVEMDIEQSNKMLLLVGLFEEELLSDEEIKSEMLRMLLVRLIIQLTRLAKKQYLCANENAEERFNMIREYNLLVELHFKKERQVQFYAGLLNRSPKTISNIFSLYCKKTPLQIIHERIITEAKRLFYYTCKSVKEIADELGFDDAAHFSKFFKNYTSCKPSDFKKNVLYPLNQSILMIK